MWPPCRCKHADEIGNDLVVAAEVDRRTQIVHVAAEAGEILAEAQQQTAGRALVVVERVVGQAVADERGQTAAVEQAPRAPAASDIAWPPFEDIAVGLARPD